MPHAKFTSNGLFLCSRGALLDVNGFNPYMQGWGWDEIDLYSRVFMAGFSIVKMPRAGVKVLAHDNELRVHPIDSTAAQRLPLSRSRIKGLNASRRMRAQNYKNQRIAISSILKQVTWPTSDQYLLAYGATSTLPSLARICLFNADEKHALIEELLGILLAPPRFTRYCWRVLQLLGVGPYCPLGKLKILGACNIDMSLVS